MGFGLGGKKPALEACEMRFLTMQGLGFFEGLVDSLYFRLVPKDVAVQIIYSMYGAMYALRCIFQC